MHNQVLIQMSELRHTKNHFKKKKNNIIKLINIFLVKLFFSCYMEILTLKNYRINSRICD